MDEKKISGCKQPHVSLGGRKFIDPQLNYKILLCAGESSICISTDILPG